MIQLLHTRQRALCYTALHTSLPLALIHTRYDGWLYKHIQHTKAPFATWYFELLLKQVRSVKIALTPPYLRFITNRDNPTAYNQLPSLISISHILTTIHMYDLKNQSTETMFVSIPEAPA